MTDEIENVKILTSQIEVGGAIVPCLAVVIEPWPENEAEIIQIGDDIRGIVQAFKGAEVD